MFQSFSNSCLQYLINTRLWMCLYMLGFSIDHTIWSQCQYSEGNAISISASGINTDPSYSTIYILTDYKDTIIAINNGTVFSALSAGVYKAYALNYLTIGGIQGLNIGQPIASIYSTCYDISEAFIVTVCPAANTTCDTYDGTLVFNGAVQGIGYTNVYVLTDNTGTILQLSPTSQFTNVGIGQYLVYGVQYNDINGLVVGQSIHEISGSCYAVSNPLWMKSCTPCTVDLGADRAICSGESATLLATTASSNVAYLWNTGQTTAQITVGPATTTTYSVTVTTQDGCTISDDIQVNVSVCNNGNCYASAGEVINFNVGGGNNDPLYTTAYVLTDYRNDIVAISNTPTFSGQAAGVYNIYAVNYLTSAGITQLGVGHNIDDLASPCFDVSEAMEIIICLPSTATCTTTTQSVTVSASAVSNGLTTQYILANASNAIVQISNTPSFSNIGIGTFLIYAINYSDIAGLTIGQQVSDITGLCYDISNPIWVKSCSSCTVTLSQDFTICNGQSVILTTSASGQGAYLWSTGQTTSSIAVDPVSTTSYAVTFTNADGCIATDEVVVSVDNCNLCSMYNCNIDCNVCGPDIVINASGENTALTTEYILTDSDGLILQVGSTPHFTNVADGTYFIFGVNYDATLPHSGLVVGGNYYNIQGQCMDISHPYIIKVCPPSLVGDYVWLDTGSFPDVQDSGDTGINGIVLQLYDAAHPSVIVQEVTTGNHPITGMPGYYQFDPQVLPIAIGTMTCNLCRTFLFLVRYPNMP